MHLINIGFGNYVTADRVVAVTSYESSPIKRMVRDARDAGKVVDATCGRKICAVLVTDTDTLVLSALQPETVAGRLEEREEKT